MRGREPASPIAVRVVALGSLVADGVDGEAAHAGVLLLELRHGRRGHGQQLRGPPDCVLVQEVCPDARRDARQEHHLPGQAFQLSVAEDADVVADGLAGETLHQEALQRQDEALQAETVEVSALAHGPGPVAPRLAANVLAHVAQQRGLRPEAVAHHGHLIGE
eukprot:8757507-Alexandrium_andersonii.AAC.1